MSSESPQESIYALARAIRFALAALVLGIAYPNIHCAFGIGRFEMIYNDMLAGKPLPGVTIFILHYRWFFAGLSVLVPIVALASVFARNAARATYWSGVAVFMAFGQLCFQWFALTAPLIEVIKGMQGPG
jgi:hypothetical protein